MNYDPILATIRECSRNHWDIVVIGGGATGAGIAFDAASRGFRTLLVEQADFGKGTSSRSTKLLHGGVRYLAQGNLILVMEALQERGIILRNAPHVTGNQEFVIPVYTWPDAIRYTIGLKIYDILAGKLSLGKSCFINPQATLVRVPTLNGKGLKGGVVYHDGWFDDSRLLISLVRSIGYHGGTALNYCRVTGLIKDSTGKVRGVKATANGHQQEFNIRADLVINATGIFADEVLRMDNPVTKRTIRPSQGIHMVFDRSFLRGDSAILIPRTNDGRVLFAIPWYDRVVAGTTDTPMEVIDMEPRALEEEINFVLQTAGKYLTRRPTRQDVLSVFAGLRPLAADPGNPANTREISRRHKITLTPSGLLTVEGGKWTIYRKMAQDAINKAMRAGLIEKRQCRTRDLPVDGFSDAKDDDPLHIYGSHAREIRDLYAGQPAWARTIHSRLPYTEAEVRWICRHEMPRKLEDVMARRLRALFLDARASREMAPDVAAIMADELGYDAGWIKEEVEAYCRLADNYIC